VQPSPAGSSSSPGSLTASQHHPSSRFLQRRAARAPTVSSPGQRTGRWGWGTASGPHLQVLTATEAFATSHLLGEAADQATLKKQRRRRGARVSLSVNPVEVAALAAVAVRLPSTQALRNPFATPLQINPPHFTTVGGPRGRPWLTKQRHTADRCMPPFGNARSAGDHARGAGIIHHCISFKRTRERARGLGGTAKCPTPGSPSRCRTPGQELAVRASPPPVNPGRRRTRVARGRRAPARPNKGPEDLRALRRWRSHLGSVPGGGSAGLRRRGPGGGEVALGRPGPSGALRRRGPAQCRRRRIESGRGRRVGGGTSRQVQVQCPRRRDAPCS
jgi:hypothetical protein